MVERRGGGGGGGKENPEKRGVKFGRTRRGSGVVVGRERVWEKVVGGGGGGGEGGGGGGGLKGISREKGVQDLTIKAVFEGCCCCLRRQAIVLCGTL